MVGEADVGGSPKSVEGIGADVGAGNGAVVGARELPGGGPILTDFSRQCGNSRSNCTGGMSQPI